jgi:hypothetical protein
MMGVVEFAEGDPPPSSNGPTALRGAALAGVLAAIREG